MAAKKLLSLLLALSLLLSCLAGCAKHEKTSTDDEDEPEQTEESSVMDTVMLRSNRTNLAVTAGMMSYFLSTEYQMHCEYYNTLSEQLAISVSIPGSYGGDKLDQTKPLRDQIYARKDANDNPLDQNVTWFEYFADRAAESATRLMALHDAAIEIGLSLSEEDLQPIDIQIGALKAEAKMLGLSFAQYLSARYGEGVRETDIREALKLSALAEKCSAYQKEVFYNSVSEDQILQEYLTNRESKYDVLVDFVGVTFTHTHTEEMTEQECARAAYYSEILAELEEAASHGIEHFTATLYNVFYNEAIEHGSTLSDAEAQAAAQLEEAIHINVNALDDSVNFGMRQWLSEATRVRGDVFTSVEETWSTPIIMSPPQGDDAFITITPGENNTFVTVTPEESDVIVISPGIMLPQGNGAVAPTPSLDPVQLINHTICVLTEPLHRDEGTVRSAGHILFRTDTFDGRTSSEGLTGVRKELADRVLQKNAMLSAELMANELLAMMLENGHIASKMENGRSYFAVSEADFATFGELYTEDSDVFYDHIRRGQTVQAFEDWVFADERIEGEISFPAAIATDYGYHILLYRGNERAAWKQTIHDELTDTMHANWLSALILRNSYTVCDSATWDLIGIDPAT